METTVLSRAIRAGSDDIARVMRALLEYSDAWQVAGHANVPFADLVNLLQQLRDHGMLEFHGSQLLLTRQGAEWARDIHAARRESATCSVCAGSGFEFELFHDAYHQFMPLVARRPPAEATYDQGALTAESVFRRLAFMYAQGDVAGKRILLLGDDDLLSVALALTGLPREIVVVEIDPRLCAFIQHLAETRQLNVRVIQHDAREKLPGDLRAHFDTFVTDPSETIQGLLLFVEKGLAMLQPGGAHAGYFGVTLIEASLHKWNLWERHLLQNHALVFTHISEPFSVYAKGNEAGGAVNLNFEPMREPPRAPWYRASFFRVETLSEFVPPVDYDSNPRDELYQDAESLEEAWLVLANGQTQSPIPIPKDFLDASAQRAAQAQYGLGRHVIAEFWNCENAQSEQGLAEAIQVAVRDARATLLDLNVRRFYPQGYSAIALLAESHLSLHAWPELGYVALDVFTCGEADPQKIVQALEAHFKPRDTEYIKIPRGRMRTHVVPEM
ncbi:MAG: adenosylmethionine decarboxylase [Chloroflexi bacterium UTCFX4]|jgi:S-adenosylmethionine decarboxylase proenzyme|nr:MAG: adenosylmethionine decarboxylase [Chloroflexi bacterium UTCFX4]